MSIITYIILCNSRGKKGAVGRGRSREMFIIGQLLKRKIRNASLLTGKFFFKECRIAGTKLVIRNTGKCPHFSLRL